MPMNKTKSSSFFENLYCHQRIIRHPSSEMQLCYYCIRLWGWSFGFASSGNLFGSPSFETDASGKSAVSRSINSHLTEQIIAWKHTVPSAPADQHPVPIICPNLWESPVVQFWKKKRVRCSEMLPVRVCEICVLFDKWMYGSHKLC